MASSRKVGAGWQGVLVDEGIIYWRCPHEDHKSRDEARSCASEHHVARLEAIDARDTEIERAYMADEITVEEAVRRLVEQ